MLHHYFHFYYFHEVHSLAGPPFPPQVMVQGVTQWGGVQPPRQGCHRRAPRGKSIYLSVVEQGSSSYL